jgi:hypothetical protein
MVADKMIARLVVVKRIVAGRDIDPYFFYFSGNLVDYFFQEGAF